ncbi:unnamed protein product, partial [Phaeothamnion confervicola]
VVVSERPAGGAFGPPEPISVPTGIPYVGHLDAPQIALGADGRAVAAWRRIGGVRPARRYRVEAAVRPAGGAWRPSAPLSPTATRNAGRPSLGLGAGGHAVVAWSQPIGRSGSAIRARALGKEATDFGRLESISSPRGRGASPSVALDAAGRAVLAWREDPAPAPGRGSGRFFDVAVRPPPG